MELFGVASRDLARMVAPDYEPDLILSIAHGGLFVAGALGYALSVKNIHVMNVEYYTGIDQRLPLPVVLPPTPEVRRPRGCPDPRRRRRRRYRPHPRPGPRVLPGKVADVRAAVLYEKPGSVIKCEYVWRTTARWIDFPWSSQAPIAGPGSG